MGRCSIVDLAAAPQNQQARGQHGCALQVVGCKQDGSLFTASLRQSLFKKFGAPGIETRERLVEQEQRRFVEQGARER